jgi:hypothetical protein
MLVIGLAIGGLAGAGIAFWRAGRATPSAGRATQTAQIEAELRARLLNDLIAIGDALQTVSPDALQARGGWDRALFDTVLQRVEAHTPAFQAALAAYLAAPGAATSGAHPPDTVAALLAVDRLSAAYTYWTRLFPPRQTDAAMFVLSLLHDLSDKVEDAIRRLDVD